MNVTLIGMPGSGKSLVGGKLADKLGYKLLELDKILEQEYRLSLQQIVEMLGAETFLDKEAEVAISQTTDRDGLVVSPGGSVVYRTHAMEYLKRISTLVYLEVPVEVIRERIGDTLRGIVNIENKTLVQLQAERTPLYKKWADHIINGSRDPDIVVVDILKATGSFASRR